MPGCRVCLQLSGSSTPPPRAQVVVVADLRFSQRDDRERSTLLRQGHSHARNGRERAIPSAFVPRPNDATRSRRLAGGRHAFYRLAAAPPSTG
ncbi:hypothetical protein GUJ93_ZPchr0007g4478 [Zizania palustris]|uniref:Uncharacterized protein n=1 Tax=Zizania palustris TaxID=103762 RepID=A0A8J5VMS9_ZIZPA|nr:hypothetical protein GUJ93_ZPchr0007g4478 [Zizania palustris]